MKRRAGLFALGCVATVGASTALKPSRRTDQIYVPVELDAQVPREFSDWRLDSSIVPLLPEPSTQAALNQIYNQTLARTYINRSGHHVMLSIAYGADQGSDGTQAHRPEICYAAQGFSVVPIEQVSLNFGRHEIYAARLVGSRDARREFITYWVTLNDKVVLPGITRQWAQLRIGLQGLIPDGMLVRVSTVGLTQALSFEMQDRFLSQLYASLVESVRARYFGS